MHQNNKTLTNLIHEQIILFLLAKNSNIYQAKSLLSEEEKKFINGIGVALCDKDIKNDIILYEALGEIAANYNNNDNPIMWFLKNIHVDNLAENDRFSNQNIVKKSDNVESENLSNLYYFSEKRDINSLADAMKNGTLSGSKAFKIIEEFDLKGKNFLDSEYAEIYLTKYDVKNKKEFGKTFNIPIIPEYLFGAAIAIFTFFSKYYEAVYFDYKNQSKLEIITVKLLKILNKEKYKDLDIKYLMDDQKDKSVGVVIKLLNARDIEEKDLSMSQTEEKNQKSFIVALAEAFIIDICDKTTMYNMMIYKNEYINIDYGLKYEKNEHKKVVKKFCEALKNKDIIKAKEIFLFEIKDETGKKVGLLKNQGFLTGKSNKQDIEDRKRVYNFAKAILNEMPDEEFVKIFSNLLNEQKVTQIQEVFAGFYLNESEYKKMHCNIGKCVGLIFDSLQEYEKSKAK